MDVPSGLLGRTVLYRLSQADEEEIDNRRNAGEKMNPQHAGDLLPMIVTWEVSTGHVNGQVLLDGCGVLWRTSVPMGDTHETWQHL